MTVVTFFPFCETQFVQRVIPQMLKFRIGQHSYRFMLCSLFFIWAEEDIGQEEERAGERGWSALWSFQKHPAACSLLSQSRRSLAVFLGPLVVFLVVLSSTCTELSVLQCCSTLHYHGSFQLGNPASEALWRDPGNPDCYLA